MKVSHPEMWVIALGCLSTLFVTIAGNSTSIGPDEACADFAAGENSTSAWTMAECTEVWTQFVDTIPNGLQDRQRYADGWRRTTKELRRLRSPCFCASYGGGDGVGSITMRLLASWIFSEEMGCDWVTPNWGKQHVRGGNGAVLYCHGTATSEDLKKPRLRESTPAERYPCSVVDWLSYFQFGVPSVNLPRGAKFRLIEVGPASFNQLEVKNWSITEDGLTDQSWDRIMFRYHVSYASRSLVSVGNWDADRRRLVRQGMERARHNFHVHPRPWYDENPKCDFHPDRLNFAIHVRMGDRRAILGESGQYFLLLERFMGTVSAEVVRRGLEPPLFHVFSETLLPCPSEDTGLFDEFPSWPVHQVPECLTAKVPDHCPESEMGKPCIPDRSGMFNVVGMPAVLHVSPDVHNAISCMIQADGLLMGCSTFGQLAGLLSKGISFFSMHCSGDETPVQYKAIPPIAVADLGHLWVPITGSWHDPRLNSTEVLTGALETLLKNKGMLLH
eukprot:jgi/Undpi1/9428/HiC_scaffold_27.g11885.m1